MKHRRHPIVPNPKAQSQGATRPEASRPSTDPAVVQAGDPAFDLSLLLGEINPRWSTDGLCLLSAFVVHVLPILVEDLLALRPPKTMENAYIAGDSRHEAYDVLLAINFLVNPAETFDCVPTMKVCWAWLRGKHYRFLGSWGTVSRELRRVEYDLKRLHSGDIPADSYEGQVLQGRYPLAYRFWSR